MICLSFRYFELYLCVFKVYNAQQDNWHKKGLNIRIGSYAFSINKGLRNWRKEA
jgi:hypothetical protein